MTDIEWSIHKDSKMLDRAGRAKATKFWYITHTQMSDTITFEMHCNNFIRAVGGLWCRHGCILMGGSFSAQAADLHNLWKVYTNRQLLRRLGSLTVSEAGFPYWESPQGITALCQFRDNILIATTTPDTEAHPIIAIVCNLLGEAWGLDVLCECMSGPGDACKHSYHSASTTALGFDMIRGETGKGLAYLHPSALSSTWSLKSAPPLLSPACAYPAYLPGIMTGALSNARPWATTWAGELLSLSAWLQISLLSGYALPQVTRAAHSVVTRGLSTSPNDHTAATSTRFAHSSQCHTVATLRCAPLGCDDMHTGRGTATVVGNWIHHCRQTAPQVSGAGTGTSSTFTPPKSEPVTMTAPPGSLYVCERVVTPISSKVPPE